MDSKIEILIGQVGRMTEGITALRIALEEGNAELCEQIARGNAELREELARGNAELQVSLKEGFDDLKVSLKEGFDDLKISFEHLQLTSERQAKNIEQLATVAAALAATTDRQSRMLEEVRQN